MWRNTLVLFVLLGLVFGYSWLEEVSERPMGLQEAENTGAGTIGTKVSQQAPDFSLTDINGKTVTLSSFKGKAVILNFWASWCAPCVVEFPQMLNLAEERGDDTVFLFLSQDDSQEEMMRLVDKLGDSAKLPNVFIAHDKNKEVAQDIYATYKLPETYLLSPAHLIEDKIVGLEMAWDSKAMREKIAALAVATR